MSHIRHELERVTLNERPVSPECRLGICLYRLSGGDYYDAVSEMAGLGESTIHGIVSEVCKTIVEYLWTEFVSTMMPSNEGDFMAMCLWQWLIQIIDSYGEVVVFLEILMTLSYSSLQICEIKFRITELSQTLGKRRERQLFLH